MGRFRRITIDSFPAWTRTLDAAFRFDSFEIKGWCTTCNGFRMVDFAKLRAAKGGGYSLINKRMRCNFTPGCSGWIRFFYMHGKYYPLWDDDTCDRWMFGPSAGK